MIKIAICEDDIQAAVQLEGYLEQMTSEGFFRTGICYDVFSHAEDFLNYRQKNDVSYNAFLMDIEMPGMDGMELGRRIRKADKDAVIIFQTSHCDRVFDSFKIHAHRFLRKPVDYEEFREAMHSAEVLLQKTCSFFYFSFAKEIFCIPCNEILFFEKEQRKVYLHTKKQTYCCYMTVKEILSRLNLNCFAQISVSHIVNLNEIRSIRKDCVCIRQQIELPVSKPFRKPLREKHLTFEMMRL